MNTSICTYITITYSLIHSRLCLQKNRKRFAQEEDQQVQKSKESTLTLADHLKYEVARTSRLPINVNVEGTAMIPQNFLGSLSIPIVK